MKSGLKRLSKNLSNLDLVQVIGDTFEFYDKQITDLARVQLSEGKKGDGTQFDFYKPATVKIKKERGTILMGERIALIDTGEFWSKLITDSFGGSLIIDNKDRGLLAELESRYGDKILSLTAESRSQLIQMMLPDIQSRVIIALTK